VGAVAGAAGPKQKWVPWVATVGRNKEERPLKYLVTGGAGFIGSHVADALVARGDEVVILDDLSTGSRSNVEHLLGGGRAELVVGTVLDAELVDTHMRSADACLHFAAAVGVRLVVEQTIDSIRSNALGSDIVMTSAARHGRRLMFASSSEVYGRGDGQMISEGAPHSAGYRMHARWAYASSKMFGEALAQSYVRELGSEMVVARLFNVVGPRQTGTYGMVLPRFVGQALSGADLTVYGDGRQSRCFVHIDDAVRALLALLCSDAATGGIYNVGSTKPIRIVDLANLVIERTASSSGVRYVPFDVVYESGVEDLDRQPPDTSAVAATIGWQPERTVEDAVDDVIQSFRSTAIPDAAGRPAVPHAA
jgi:UDP-glucose 4-epimerase